MWFWDPIFNSDMYGHNLWIADVWTLMQTMLSWDIVKGGLAFCLGLGIALFAVATVRRAFGGE